MMWYLQCFSPSPQGTARAKGMSWGRTMDAPSGCQVPGQQPGLQGAPSLWEEASLGRYPEGGDIIFAYQF